MHLAVRPAGAGQPVFRCQPFPPKGEFGKYTTLRSGPTKRSDYYTLDQNYHRMLNINMSTLSKHRRDRHQIVLSRPSGPTVQMRPAEVTKWENGIACIAPKEIISLSSFRKGVWLKVLWGLRPAFFCGDRPKRAVSTLLLLFQSTYSCDLYEVWLSITLLRMGLLVEWRQAHIASKWCLKV